MKTHLYKAYGLFLAVVAIAYVGYLLCSAGSQLAHQAQDRNSTWEQLSK